MTRNLKPNQQILKPDKRLLEACEQLRHTVEHPNERSDVIMQQGIYKQKDPEEIMTVKVDGVEVGYKVKPSSDLEMSPYFDRCAYIKMNRYHLDELVGSKEMKDILQAVFDAFFEPQQGQIDINQIADDCLMIRQRFMVAFPVERSPGLRSIVGGFNA